MILDGIKVTQEGLEHFTAWEAQNYIDYVRGQVKCAPIREIHVKMCDDGKVDVSYLAQGEKFERIRRITG